MVSLIIILHSATFILITFAAFRYRVVCRVCRHDFVMFAHAGIKKGM